MREADLGRRAPVERRLADEALVDDAAERVNVALPARLAPFDQLGRQVVRRPEDLPVRGQPGGFGAARNAEVGERRRTGTVEEHVRRLHVAVQDSALVQRIEASAELRREPAGRFRLQMPRRAQERGQ